MPRYAETQKLLERDLSRVSPDTAVKNIEMWEESLAALDSKEGKALARDLAALRKELGKGEPDGAKIQELMGKLGDATTALAGEAPDATGEKLRGIGEALHNAKAGDGSGEDDDASDDDGRKRGGRAKADDDAGGGKSSRAKAGD